MPISFDSIPVNLRVPLVYGEFSNVRAIQGLSTQPYKVLMIGSRLASGSKAELDPQLVTSAEQAAEYFGEGSILADMVASYLSNNKSIPLTCVALDDDGAGVKAAGTVTYAGTATKAGTVSLMIGGKRIRAAVAVGDTASDVAAAIVAAAASVSGLVVDLAVNGVTAEQVDITAKNAGEFGNEIDIRHNYYSGEELPAGITQVTAAMAGGSANPDISNVWAALGETQYILIVSPYLDSANLTEMDSELADRFGPLRQNDGYALHGKRDSHANLITFGDGLNSAFLSIMGVVGPSSPWQFASAMAGQVALAGSIDPARPFQTLELSGILAPKESERFTLDERNLLLQDGIATFNVDSGDSVLIEAVITTYQENAFGAPDESYLYLNTLLTLSYIRFDLRALFTQKYPRAKLADDGTRFGAGQVVITPLVAKAEVVSRARQWEENGLIENLDQFKEDIISERDASNPNRLNMLLPPDLINQLRILAQRIEFIL